MPRLSEVAGAGDRGLTHREHRPAASAPDRRRGELAESTSTRSPRDALLRAILLSALLAAAVSPLASAAAETGGDRPARPGPVILDQRPAEGQQCIVCRLPVREGEIVELRYKGRKFFVSAKMLGELEANPDVYFHLMQAHGGLFDEAAMETPPMRLGWLALGLYVLAGLVAGAGCSYVALGRGLGAWGWFFAGMALNALALAAVLTRQRRPGAPAPAGLTKIPVTSSPVACDGCGAGNHPAAAACSGCGRALTPSVEPETARA